MRWGLVLCCCVVSVLLGCEDLFEYSPNQSFDHDSQENLNALNIERLENSPNADDTITIAFIGDSQRFYDEADQFIERVNQIPSIDFVLLAGDISDFGLLEEFELIADRFSKLSKPYIAVVGNHDLMAKGEETFEHMFGPLDFTFTYDDVKFIAHNTNGREYSPGEIPDLDWLGAQFEGAKHFVTVSHVPPFSGDFDPSLERPYAALLNNHKPLISLHGHVHEFQQGYMYNDNVWYMTSHSFELQQFVLLKIAGGKVTYELIDY